jgi:AcrR family transcriptional regulator
MTVHRASPVRRGEIADAALAVFGQSGLAGFTMAAIGREIGVTDAALFRHFPGKQAIVAAAIDRAEEILFEGADPTHASGLERLGQFFLRRVQVLQQRPGVSRLLVSEQLAELGSPAAAKRARELKSRSQALVRACIRQAAVQGELAPGTSREVAAVLILGAMMALGHRHLTSRTKPAAAEVWSALERALRGQRPRPRSAGRRTRGRRRAAG